MSLRSKAHNDKKNLWKTFAFNSTWLLAFFQNKKVIITVTFESYYGKSLRKLCDRLIIHFGENWESTKTESHEPHSCKT